ncbi:hypothetical protein DRN74_06865, partial [Candidatus Micrarchaeota archaeon]
PGEDVVFTVPGAGLLQIVKPSGNTEEVVCKGGSCVYENKEGIEIGDYKAFYYTAERKYELNFSVSLLGTALELSLDKEKYAIGEAVRAFVKPYLGIELAGVLIDPVGNEMPFKFKSREDGYEAVLNVSTAIVLDSPYLVRVSYGGETVEKSLEFTLRREEHVKNVSGRIALRENLETAFAKLSKLAEKVGKAKLGRRGILKLGTESFAPLKGAVSRIIPFKSLGESFEVIVEKQNKSRKSILFGERGPIREVENGSLYLPAGNYYLYSIEKIGTEPGNDRVAVKKGRKILRVSEYGALRWNAWDIDYDGRKTVIHSNGPDFVISGESIEVTKGDFWADLGFYLGVDGERVNLMKLEHIEYPESDGLFERYVRKFEGSFGDVLIKGSFEFFELGKMKFSVTAEGEMEHNYSLVVKPLSNKRISFEGDYVRSIGIGNYSINFDRALFENDGEDLRILHKRALSSREENGSLVIRYPRMRKLVIDPLFSTSAMQDEVAETSQSYCANNTGASNSLIVGYYSSTYSNMVSYVWFDLSYLPRYVVVEHANLSLYCRYVNSPVDIEVYHMEARDTNTGPTNVCNPTSPSSVGGANDYGSYRDHEACTGTNPKTLTVSNSNYQWINISIDPKHVEWENNDSGAGGGGSNDKILFKINYSGTGTGYVECDSAEATNVPVLYVEYRDRKTVNIWNGMLNFTFNSSIGGFPGLTVYNYSGLRYDFSPDRGSWDYLGSHTYLTSTGYWYGSANYPDPVMELIERGPVRWQYHHKGNESSDDGLYSKNEYEITWTFHRKSPVVYTNASIIWNTATTIDTTRLSDYHHLETAELNMSKFCFHNSTGVMTVKEKRGYDPFTERGIGLSSMADDWIDDFNNSLGVAGIIYEFRKKPWANQTMGDKVSGKRTFRGKFDLMHGAISAGTRWDYTMLFYIHRSNCTDKKYGDDIPEMLFNIT